MRNRIWFSLEEQLWGRMFMIFFTNYIKEKKQQRDKLNKGYALKHLDTEYQHQKFNNYLRVVLGYRSSLPSKLLKGSKWAS